MNARLLIPPIVVSVATLGHAEGIVANPSFGAMYAGVRSLRGWTVDGPARATMVRTAPGSHGESALRITSASPRRPRIFVRLSQRLSVKPNTTSWSPCT